MADQPRSLKSFGVAGALREDCTIYYTSDYRSRNIGRFSDLMAAKLREVDADELRIRALLLFSLYESYAAIGKTFRSLTEMPPVSLEIGFDQAQLAIGVTFHWKEGRSPIISGISQRVPNGVYQTPFEEVLGFLRQHCAKLVVKHEANERRVEILTLLDRNDGDRRDPMEVVEVDSALAPYLEAKEYIEMGDLDYLGLTGEQTLETDLTVSGGENGAARAGTAGELDEIQIDGDLPADDESVTRLLSETSGSGEEPVLVRGSSASADPEEEAVRIRAAFEDHVNELQRRIQELEDERRLKTTSVEEELGTAAPEREKGESAGAAARKPEGEVDGAWGMGFLKQIWPFGEGEGDEEAGAEEASMPRKIKAGRSASSESDPELAVFSAGESDENVEPDEATRKIIDELKTMASAMKGSAKFQQVVQEIGDDGDPAKSKRWVEGLMSEVLQEKAQLAELSKNLAKQARQRELDYKSKERAMQAEFSRLSEQLKRKDTQLERNREQIAQLNLALERAKNASSAGEDQQMKLRLTTAQRIAQSKEEENRSLAQKVKSLEDRLIVAQARSSRPAVDPQMVARLQSAERKAEELKRLNQRLIENLNQQKKDVGDKDAAGLRRKVETMERQAVEMRKSLEKAQFRVRELQEAERKLQADHQKALDENRKLRGGSGRSSGGDGQAA